jgi:uncharacterized protein (DUF2235 family)
MKKIVLCCDGTWNSADQETNGVPCPTNVVKLGYRVAKHDAKGTPQIVYYDEGVGTGNFIDRVSGGAFGEGLEQNIHDAYRFLASNYEPGDQLYVFGFSRGAFTARSIVGMIRKCGVLALKNVKHYREALELYRNESRPADAGPTQFRTNYCAYGNEDIKVDFIGVWDTVGALGIPLRGLRWLTRKDHQFHDTQLSGIVQRACHALAIDEYRGSFEPATWDYAPKEWQRVEQVWFCGAHSDVGGGYAEHQLSDIALEWMIGKARDAGLTFDQEVITANPLDPSPAGKIHDSKARFYNLAPDFNRTIGTSKKTPETPEHADPTQSLHPSVLARWDKDSSYRPKPLIEYFKRIGDPRAKEHSEAEAETPVRTDVG